MAATTTDIPPLTLAAAPMKGTTLVGVVLAEPVAVAVVLLTRV